MKVRTLMTGILASGALVIGGAGSASANIAWCTSDPPVHVDTESGANVTVNTSVTVAKSESGYLNEVTSDAVAVANGAGGTNITVNVNLPAGISTATVLVQVKRYHVSASAAGHGGTAVTLYITVPAA
jgi:hypothetical protein